MTPTVHFAHTATHTLLNYSRAWRVALTTIALYLVSAFLIERHASVVAQLTGMVLLVGLIQLAHGTPFRTLSLAVRCVTDTPDRPEMMTDAACALAVAMIESRAKDTLQHMTMRYPYAHVALDIRPELFAELLSGVPVEIPMSLHDQPQTAASPEDTPDD